jgi:hypothetical protein
MSADRVQVLEKLYEQGQSNDLVDLALEKLFAYELDASEKKLDQLEQDLAEFERQYGLASAHFYREFQSGEMGDAMDFVEWASLYQMAARLQERIDLLTKGIL